MITAFSPKSEVEVLAYFSGRVKGILEFPLSPENSLSRIASAISDLDHALNSIRSNGLYPLERPDGCVCPACKDYRDFESDVDNPNLESEVTR